MKLTPGAKAEFTCECCGIDPAWGEIRGLWWLTCDCWQTALGSPEEVLLAWENDKEKRIKWPMRDKLFDALENADASYRAFARIAGLSDTTIGTAINHPERLTADTWAKIMAALPKLTP